MGRNLVIVKTDGEFRSFNNAAEDEHLVSLGARGSVIEAVDAHFPGITWSEGGSGDLTDVRFDIGIDDPVEDLVVTLDDDARFDEVVELVRTNGWHLTDSGMGDFLDLE